MNTKSSDDEAAYSWGATPLSLLPSGARLRSSFKYCRWRGYWRVDPMHPEVGLSRACGSITHKACATENMHALRADAEAHGDKSPFDEASRLPMTEC